MELRKVGLARVGSGRRGIQSGGAQLERGRITFVGLIEYGKAWRRPASSVLTVQHITPTLPTPLANGIIKSKIQ